MATMFRRIHQTRGAHNISRLRRRTVGIAVQSGPKK